MQSAFCVHLQLMFASSGVLWLFLVVACLSLRRFTRFVGDAVLASSVDLRVSWCLACRCCGVMSIDALPAPASGFESQHEVIVLPRLQDQS
jgi:hypothetical protein